MKDKSSKLDNLTNQPAELNSGGDPMLLESYLTQRRPHYIGGFFGAIQNLNQVELSDSTIPDGIAMDEHFFPEK